jgi:hypothetical protein
VPVISHSPPGTDFAISCPSSWGWFEPLTSALGARIRPCHATPRVTFSAVARGRFQISRSAPPAGVTVSPPGAIVRAVMVSTVINALASSSGSSTAMLLTFAAEPPTSAAPTRNTLRPGELPRNVSVPLLNVTVAPGVGGSSLQRSESRPSARNSSLKLNGGGRRWRGGLTVKFGATERTAAYRTPPSTLPPSPSVLPALRLAPVMIVGGSSPGPGRTTAPSSVTVLPAAMRPVIVVPPTWAAVNLPCERTAKPSAAPSEKHAAARAVGGGAASGPAGRAPAPPTATAAAAHANNPARRGIHLRYAAGCRSVKPTPRR